MADRRRSKDVARKDNAKRTLMWLFAFIIMLTGALGYGVWKKDASWTPALGLDLEGGFQFILSPRSTEGGSVSQQQLEEARDIIVQRIDAQGTSGAELTTQGSSNIVVAMPGWKIATIAKSTSRTKMMMPPTAGLLRMKRRE